MFNIKRILLAVFISCSMGALAIYPQAATAELRANKEVIKDVLESLNEALAKVDNKESKDAILESINNARQASKEINVGSLGAIVDRGNDAIIASRRNVKNDDMPAATDSLKSAIDIYTEMGKKTL